LAGMLNGGLGHTALDLIRGELQCPLCKTVANMLIPAPTEQVSESSRSNSNEVPTDVGENVVNWLRVLVEDKLTIRSEEDEDESKVPTIVSSFMRSMYELYDARQVSLHGELEGWRGRESSAPIKELLIGCCAFAYSTSLHLAEKNHMATHAVEMAEESSNGGSGGGANGIEKHVNHLTYVAKAIKSYAQTRQVSEALGLELHHILSSDSVHSSTPLLCRNVLETLAALLLLPAERQDVSSALFSMSLARLVQLLWAELPPIIPSEITEDLDDVDTAMIELGRFIRTEAGRVDTVDVSGGGGGGGATSDMASHGIKQGIDRVKQGMAAFQSASRFIVNALTDFADETSINVAHVLRSNELLGTVRSWVRRALSSVTMLETLDIVVRTHPPHTHILV
jgi:hypothetical protein